MNNRFSEHSANERTFLAWVRTALAIVGFGILVDKLGNQGAISSGIGNTGLILLLTGACIVISASIRFFLIRKHIDRDEMDATSPVLLDVTLIIVLVLLFAALMGFGAHIVLPD